MSNIENQFCFKDLEVKFSILFFLNDYLSSKI